MQQLPASKFQLGADASAAAGPVGGHASAGTDWKLETEILTYSRARDASRYRLQVRSGSSECQITIGILRSAECSAHCAI
jgi:hypothetical protein